MKKITFSPPDLTLAEVDEVKAAILSGWITTGPRVHELERRISNFLKVKRAVCMNSQTACAEIALRLLGIGEGDEVIVTSYTYSASASVVCHVGAKLVLVDTQRNSLEMDYDQVERSITGRTKAIIPVDLAGIPCDYDRIFALVESKKSLFVPSNEIQRKIGRIAICADTAHSLGSSRGGIMAGAIADFSSTSFHAVKALTTAEGGAMTWNLPFGDEQVPSVKNGWTVNGIEDMPIAGNETWNDYLYRLAHLYCHQGQSRDAYEKNNTGTWDYDIIRPWYVANMTDIAAAIGLVQLDRYPSLLSKRRRIVDKYDHAMRSIGVKTLDHYNERWTGNGYLYMCRVPGIDFGERQKIIDEMAEKGVSCSVQYRPLPMMTAYRRLGYDISDFPNAYAMFENEISLPMHTLLTDDDVDYVIECFSECVRRRC